MQNQRNQRNRGFSTGNRFPNENFDGSNGLDYQRNRNYRDSGRNYYGDRRQDEWDTDEINDYQSRRYGSFSNYGAQQNDEPGKFEEDYEDVTEGYGRYNGDHSNRNYGSPYNQQGNRRYGANGRGYNELNGGRNDQYDRDRDDDWNRNQWGRHDTWNTDRNSNNGYNSFDRYADRGNYNTARNNGGGYGSTSNRYEDSFSRDDQPGRYNNDQYSFSNGRNNRQGQRNQRNGFGSMGAERSSERRGSQNLQGRRESVSNR